MQYVSTVLQCQILAGVAVQTPGQLVPDHHIHVFPSTSSQMCAIMLLLDELMSDAIYETPIDYCRTLLGRCRPSKLTLERIPYSRESHMKSGFSADRKPLDRRNQVLPAIAKHLNVGTLNKAM